jgi:hypothetical protein
LRETPCTHFGSFMLGNQSVSFAQPVAWNQFGQCMQLSLLCWTVGKAVFHWHPDGCAICLNARAVQCLRFWPFVITHFSTIVSNLRDAGWDGCWCDQMAVDAEHSWLSDLDCVTAWLLDCVFLQLVGELLASKQRFCFIKTTISLFLWSWVYCMFLLLADLFHK